MKLVYSIVVVADDCEVASPIRFKTGVGGTFVAPHCSMDVTKIEDYLQAPARIADQVGRVILAAKEGEKNGKDSTGT